MFSVNFELLSTSACCHLEKNPRDCLWRKWNIVNKNTIHQKKQIMWWVPEQCQRTNFLSHKVVLDAHCNTLRHSNILNNNKSIIFDACFNSEWEKNDPWISNYKTICCSANAAFHDNSHQSMAQKECEGIMGDLTLPAITENGDLDPRQAIRFLKYPSPITVISKIYHNQ